MVVTRSQLENLSSELINRLLEVENIEDKLEHLNFTQSNELHSELQVSKNCSNCSKN